MVNINVFWSRPQSYYDSALWAPGVRRRRFMNQASHYVGLLTGSSARWRACRPTATLARHIQVEDTGVVSIRWRTGTLGSMNVTMLTCPKNFEGSITIVGEQGTVRVGGVAVNRIEHWEFADQDPDDAMVEQASYETTSVYGFGHPLYYDNVINSLRGEAVPDTDGREGLHSLEILIATYLSARDGRRVALPLEY
jgi:UDP-N-acetyl-2-amino-2-deoxyglucuronate dehydrogenase